MTSTIATLAIKSKGIQQSASSFQSEQSEQLSAVSDCREEVIQQKAYLLWESSGKPEGDGVDFWLKAEAALAEEIALAATRKGSAVNMIAEEVVVASFGRTLLSEVNSM